MWRYEDGISDGLLGLGIKIMTDIFHCRRVYESINIEFRI